MEFFGKFSKGYLKKDYANAISEELQPISHDLIAKVLSSFGFQSMVEEDKGYLHSMVDGDLFIFYLDLPRKDFLTISASWNFIPPNDLVMEFLDACNNWNRTQVFPAASVQKNKNSLLCFSTFSARFKYGVNQKQLSSLISSSICGTKDFFNFLAENFPQHVDWRCFRK